MNGRAGLQKGNEMEFRLTKEGKEHIAWAFRELEGKMRMMSGGEPGGSMPDEDAILSDAGAVGLQWSNWCGIDDGPCYHGDCVSLMLGRDIMFGREKAERFPKGKAYVLRRHYMHKAGSPAYRYAGDDVFACREDAAALVAKEAEEISDCFPYDVPRKSHLEPGRMFLENNDIIFLWEIEEWRSPARDA